MAKDDDSRPPGWDEPPVPLDARGPRGGLSRQLSLRNIMVVLVYFALVFGVGHQVVETNQGIQYVLLAVLIGLGLAALGLWAAFRMTRYSVIGWIIFVIGYMTITGATVNVFAIPSLPILIGSIIYLSFRRRANEQDGLLWVLDVAAERGMPLAPGVYAYADQVTGIFHIWASSLAELIRQGVALPDAIESLPKVARRGVALLIRMGWESGNLAAGLREAAHARSRSDLALRASVGRIAYLTWVVVMGMNIIGFMLYFIIPKFEAIFKDFGLSLPEITIFVIRASHFVIDYTWVAFFPALAFGIYAIATAFKGADVGIPLVDRVFRRRHTILLLRAMAVVISAGRPIGPALHSMAQYYPTRWVRKKLEAASLYESQGVGWPEAMHGCGLLSSSDLGVIEASRKAGNLPWALRELAEVSERRRGYALLAWSQILFALAMLVLGVTVFLIAAAFFLPLTSLIQRLST